MIGRGPQIPRTHEPLASKYYASPTHARVARWERPFPVRLELSCRTAVKGYTFLYLSWVTALCMKMTVGRSTAACSSSSEAPCIYHSLCFPFRDIWHLVASAVTTTSDSCSTTVNGFSTRLPGAGELGLRHLEGQGSLLLRRASDFSWANPAQCVENYALVAKVCKTWSSRIFASHFFGGQQIFAGSLLYQFGRGCFLCKVLSAFLFFSVFRMACFSTLTHVILDDTQKYTSIIACQYFHEFSEENFKLFTNFSSIHSSVLLGVNVACVETRTCDHFRFLQSVL